MAKNPDAKKTQNRGNRQPLTPNQRRAARTVAPEADMDMGGRARMSDVGRGGGRSEGSGGKGSKERTAAYARRGGRATRARTPR
jgi:hypothetical protein